MKLLNLSVILSCCVLMSCQSNTSKEAETKVTFQNKGHELVYKMVQTVGTYQQLQQYKDVSYTYTYTTPDGKSDVSNEKYIFDGELSYGEYVKHERTLPDLEGRIEQGYDGTNFWLKQDGKAVEDEAALKRVTFNRKTNFYWFTMMQKLLDPGLNYEYIKQDTIDEKVYDIVKISFESEDGKPTDIYQVYINQETSIVDQFLFTVMDFGVADPLLMKMEYEKVGELLIPTKRKYTKADWDGNNLNENWIPVNWTDIKFNTGLTKEQFEL